MTSVMAAPAELLRRVTKAVTGPPRCSGCEGRAVGDWHVMPSGGIFGLCGRCAKQCWQELPTPPPPQGGAPPPGGEET